MNKIRWQVIHTLRDGNLAVEIRHTVSRDGRPWYSLAVGASPFADDDRVLRYVPVRDVSRVQGQPQLDDTCSVLSNLLADANAFIVQHIQDFYAQLVARDQPKKPKAKKIMRPGKTDRKRKAKAQ